MKKANETKRLSRTCFSGRVFCGNRWRVAWMPSAVPRAAPRVAGPVLPQAATRPVAHKRCGRTPRGSKGRSCHSPVMFLIKKTRKTKDRTRKTKQRTRRQPLSDQASDRNEASATSRQLSRSVNQRQTWLTRQIRRRKLLQQEASTSTCPRTCSSRSSISTLRVCTPGSPCCMCASSAKRWSTLHSGTGLPTFSTPSPRSVCGFRATSV